MTKSPRRLREQVRETVGEQVRDLPLHAVRLAMFGVGRALLLSDRVTRDYKEITEGGGVKPVIGRLRDDVQSTAEKVVGRVTGRPQDEEPEPEPKPVRRTRTAQPGRSGQAAARRTGEEISIGKPGAGTRHAPRHARPGPPPKPAKPGALGRHHATGAADESGPVAKPAPSPEPETPKPEPAPQAKPAPSPKPAEPEPVKPRAVKPEPAKPEPVKPEPAEPAEPAAEEPGAEPPMDEPAEVEPAKDVEESAFEPKPESRPAAQAEAARIAEDLPVPNYDTATLPQLRARLRGLSVEQVKLLREYERKHAGREDVVRMYERRIAKLNGLN